MHAADILKYGQLTVLQSIDGFPTAAWEKPGACGHWSVKDIIAHLASYEQVALDILVSLSEQGPAPTLNSYLEPGGQFNEREVDLRHTQTSEQVLAELNNIHAQVMRRVAALPPEMLCQSGILPWYGASYDLEDVFVYMYYGHKREHSAQIAAFRDQL